MAGGSSFVISLICSFVGFSEAFAQIRLIETGAPNSKYVSLQAPASVPSNFTWTLPSGDGSSNQCLATNGSGQLIWYTPAGGGTGYSLNANDGSPTNALYVEGAGNVGIGTTAARVKLEVSGGAWAGTALTDTSAGADAKTWDYVTNAGVLYLRAVNDAYSAATNYMQITRSGYGISNVSFPNGNVGIGTPTPATKFHIEGTDSSPTALIRNTNSATSQNPQLSIQNFMGSTGAGMPSVNTYSARGSTASAAAVQTNDVLGRFIGFGEGGSGASGTAYIDFIAQGNFTPSSGPTGIRLSTTPTGSTNSFERVRIDQAGNVGIGLSNPSVNLDVKGGVRAGSSTVVTTCGSGASNGEGTQRYNYTNHVMEYCNGTAWVPTSALNNSIGTCTTANQGQMAYDASSGQMMICNGGAWMTFAQVTVSYTMMAAGQPHSCGISNGGSLFCWGLNTTGQLGIGTSGNQFMTPKQVGTSSSWSAISAGYFYSGNASSCAINAGKMYCWGWNGYQQLGTGNTTNYSTPQQIGSATDWTQVSQGGLHTCGIRGGLMHCWGYNANGQLGTGNATNFSTPQQIGSSTGWTAVTAAYLYANGGATCGIDSGKLYCWGANGYGQLGLGNNTAFNTPQQVGALTSWTAVSTDGISTCGIAAGKLYCWGYNVSGELGLGNTTTFTSPQQVGSATNWTAISISYTNGGSTCGIAAGSLYCWGNNTYGQLGLGNSTSFNTPQQVGTATNWTNINLGPNGYGSGGNACGVAGGVGYCWGSNGYGQVGNNTATDVNVPTAVSAAGGT